MYQNPAAESTFVVTRVEEKEGAFLVDVAVVSDGRDGRTKPPLSHEEFAKKFREWVEKGAASPE
jgi:hypothetical protein